MPFSKKTTVFYFFVIPALFYLGLVTQFTFDLFGYDHLWKAYNAQALSILNGTLDVPYEAIGRESVYYNDKVYFYYGYFPTLFRLLLSPVVDLNTLPLARTSVWLMKTIGAASLQYALIFYTRPKNSDLQWDFINNTKLIILSLIVWFGSAHFIIIQKGIIYHEPYAAMLMLSSLFIVCIYRDVFWDFGMRQYRLSLYALLAAMCLHARQTIAISLYLGVIVLIIMMTIDTVNSQKKGNQFRLYFVEFVKNGYKPFLILFLGGALLLLLNYLRFDDLFAMSKGEYGYFRAGEEFSPRVCSSYIAGAGRFEMGRIIPNLIYYVKGGGYIHGRLIDYLGLGFVRLEYRGIQFIWLWSSLLLAFFVVTSKLVKDLKSARSAKTTLTLVLLVVFIISSLFLLAYKTITIRYVADLWLPLGFTLLLFSKKWISEKKSATNYLWYLLPISIVVNVTYSTYVYTEYGKWDLSTSINGLPSKEILYRLYNPAPRKLSKSEACKKYNFKTR